MGEHAFPVIDYWEGRYRRGKKDKGSGLGSKGMAAKRKAEFVNRLIASRGIRTVVDWGCGDGIVARLIEAPEYIGLDVSPRALELCERRAPGREWILFDGETDPGVSGDLALSLDVLFHLVDDRLYRRYVELLFASAPLVCITAANVHRQGEAHVLHRRFLSDIPSGWRIVRRPKRPRWGVIDYWILEKGEA